MQNVFARRGRQRVEYLCYTTGEVERRDELGQDRRELLARVLSGPVDPAAEDAWVERTEPEEPMAEEPAVLNMKSGPMLHVGVCTCWTPPAGSRQTPRHQSMYSFQKRWSALVMLALDCVWS